MLLRESSTRDRRSGFDVRLGAPYARKEPGSQPVPNSTVKDSVSFEHFGLDRLSGLPTLACGAEVLVIHGLRLAASTKPCGKKR